MKRLGLALALSLATAGLVTASAASLGTINSSLGASDAAVVACDTDGVSATYSLLFTTGVGFTVDRVTVANIDPACVGRRLDVVLTRGGTSVGQGGGTVSATTTTVSVSGTPSARDVDDIHIAIN